MARQINTADVRQSDIDALRARRASAQADVTYINALRNLSRAGITDALRDILATIVDDLTELRRLRLEQIMKIDEVIAKCIADGRGA